MQKDTMSERRMALLIATDTYTDPTFNKLAAPQADAEALALFADAGRDDLLLLYFSGHGVKDDAGRLARTRDCPEVRAALLQLTRDRDRAIG
jgi:uncharacterized caspase-like protein